MFEKIKESVRKFVRGIGSKEEIEQLVREIQIELIKADVEIELVHELSKRIKNRLFVDKIPPEFTRREYALKVIYEEMARILGEKAEFVFRKGKILLFGLYGSGKTTTCGKLAYFLKKRGLKVGLISLDIHRAAAQEQLEQIAQKVGVEYYVRKGCGLEELIKDGFKFLEERKCDVIIVDCAGRDALNKELIDELKWIEKKVSPEKKLLVISGDMGQAASNLAKGFETSVGIDGVIITKMDSAAKGGGALTSCFYSKAKVLFLGTGEKLEELEIYEPEKLISRMLGFTDLKEVIEKLKTEVDVEKAKKFVEGEFGLEEFCEQLQTAYRAGIFKQIANIIPFKSKALPEMENFEAKSKKFRYILDSMTNEERSNPDVLDGSRIRRIAKGSGTSEQEVRELLRLYNQTRKMSKKLGSLKGRNLRALIKQFGSFNIEP